MKKIQIILVLLLISWAMGLSSRVIYQYLIGYGAYAPNTFDVLFDWSGLFILGALNYVYWMREIYIDLVNKNVTV